MTGVAWLTRHIDIRVRNTTDNLRHIQWTELIVRPSREPSLGRDIPSSVCFDRFVTLHLDDSVTVLAVDGNITDEFIAIFRVNCFGLVALHVRPKFLPEVEPIMLSEDTGYHDQIVMVLITFFPYLVNDLLIRSELKP